MKIVHVINYFQHQLGYQEYFLAKEHVKAGHDVYVITSNKYFPFPDYDNTVKNILGEREFEVREEVVDGIKIFRLKGVLEQPARRIWMKNFFSVFKKVNPDLVILHGVYNYYSLLLPIYQRFKKFKMVMDSHDHYTENFKKSKNPVTKILIGLYSYVVNSSNARLVAVTNQTKNFMVNEYKLKENKIEVLPLGGDINYFSHNPELRKITRKKLNVTDDDTLLVYTGKIIYTKDPVLILEAVKDIYSEYKIKVLFVGNTSKDYIEKVNSYKNIFKDNFIVKDAVANSDLLKYYSAADIGIWPKEASMSSIDAMSCGLPIIICDYLTERLSNNNGIGIRESNIPDLKNAIVKIITDKKLKMEMGKNGTDLAKKEFDWRIIASKFIGN
jgi:glycosyltransferase involved in cell wall biosynthesis